MTSCKLLFCCEAKNGDGGTRGAGTREAGGGGEAGPKLLG